MNRPTTIERLPPIVPYEGKQTLPAAGNLVPLAEWSPGDHVPRAATLVMGGQVASNPSENFGIMAKITQIGERGSVVQWCGLPNIIPVCAKKVTVEAQITRLPYMVANVSPTKNAGASVPNLQVRPRFPLQAGDIVNIGAAAAFATMVDGWGDQPPASLVASNVPATILNQPCAPGPLYVTACSFTNVGSTAVQILICDGQPGSPPSAAFGSGVANGSIIVPAGSTSWLGADLLGPYMVGLQTFALLDLTAGPPAWGGNDTNGANVLVTVSGVLLGLP